MSNRKQERKSKRGARRRETADTFEQAAMQPYQLGDATVGGSAFDPITGRFELDGLINDPNVTQIIGDPLAGGEPTIRAATLDDCEDDCPVCQHMREQILAGNPPQIMAFD